jgi:hypothetical protein
METDNRGDRYEVRATQVNGRPEIWHAGRVARVHPNDGESAFARDCQPEVVGIIGGIGDDDIGGHAFDERPGLRYIACLAGGEDEAHRTGRRDGSWWSGRRASVRWPDCEPPFAPLECWWARTMVESTIRYSKSGSSDIASKMRRQMPFSLHRLKRRKTLFHSPNASGRSRHGEPVRTIHKTHSTNIRFVASCRTALIGPTDDQARHRRPLIVAQHQPIHDTQGCLPKAVLNHNSCQRGI